DQCLAFRHIGPEEASQPGALDSGRVPEREESQEPEPLAGAETRQRLAMEAHLERAKEMDRQRRDADIFRDGGGLGSEHRGVDCATVYAFPRLSFPLPLRSAA